MGSPFETLGLRPAANEDEVRAAYRALAKQWHPDRFTDPEQKEKAQQRFIELNHAYSEALQLAARMPKQAFYRQPMSPQESLNVAAMLLQKDKPEGALRELRRTTEHSIRWYELYGRTLMALQRYEEAHQAFREVVRMEPDNNAYRAEALQAAVAMKKEQTFGGRLRKIIRGIRQNR